MKPFFSVPLETLSLFSQDGLVYWSFGHLIFPRFGSLLLVPVGVAEGNLKKAICGCPVPWEEVFDVLDAPSISVCVGDEPTLPDSISGLFSGGWRKESFLLAQRSKPSRRFIHQSGITFADL